MDLTNINELRDAMRLAGLKPKKSLGQHFLIDRESLGSVMAAANLLSGDTVLEIGPGLGVMTMPLLSKVGKVIAVESDGELCALLRRHTAPNLEVVESDILRFDLTSITGDYKVVANIPYYLTSPIFRLLLESSHKPTIVSVLIQKEVAERIVAKPGKMSILALSVQFYACAELICIVERHKFWPAPAVDSAVLRLTVYPKPLFEADAGRLFRLIKAGFGEKRKQLKNSLSGGLNITSDASLSLLVAAKIPSSARAQELTMAEWQRLYQQASKAEFI